MSSASVPNPLPANQDSSYKLLTAVWIQALVTLILFALRLFARFTITHTSWDDLCMCIAVLASIIDSAFYSVNASRGGGRHIWYLASQTQDQIAALYWISQFVGNVGIVFGQLSVVLLLIKTVAPSGWRKPFLWVLIGASFAAAGAKMGILASECKETKTFWELSAGKCWDRKKVNDWQIAASSFSAAVNLVLALLPAQVIWGLHIKRQAKIRLSFLLGLGLFAFICAAVQVSTLRGLLADPDLFWNTQDVLIWSTTELNIIIWAACFPIARPVWIKAGRAIRGKFSRHPDNGPDNGTDNGLVGPLELETTTTTPAEASITCPPPVAQPSTFGYNHWHPDEECISNEAEVPPNRIKKTVDVQYSYEPRQEEFCAMDIPQNLEVGPESRYAYGPPQEAQSQPFVNPQNLGNKAYS